MSYKILCRVLPFLLLTVHPVLAQFDTAAIVGTVRDERGDSVPAAKITVLSKATGLSQIATTNATGDFVFPAVKIGEYKITAEMQGFSRTVVDNVTATVNARQRVDIMLKIGQVTETITVVESAPLLETDSSSKGQVIGEKQLANLPMLGRNYSKLALLTPGVRESQAGNQGDIAFRREGSYNVNGLRSVFNNFLLDGVDNNFYGTTNQGFSNQAIQPSPDSVAEFRMMVNSYSAEYGRTGGAVMNVASKSGTNKFHGAAWDYLQNTALNATGFFKPTDNKKPNVKRNQYGFTVGGPLVKDRTFFFADYEGSRYIANPFGLASIPSIDQRNGILPGDVRVPYNFTDSSGRLVTAGTIIPAGQPIPMTKFARQVLAALPAPNRAGGGVLGVASNFGGEVPNRLDEDKGAIKVDHKINERVQSFFRYAQRRQNIIQPGLISGFSGGNAIGTLDVYNQQGIAGVTYTRSATELMEFRFAVTRAGMDRLPAQVGGPSMRDLFGITGLPEGDRVRGGVTPQDITGFGRIGRQSTNPQAQFPTTINLRANYSKLLRAHNLKFGYEWLNLFIDVDDTNPLYGIDGYGGAYSRPAGYTPPAAVAGSAASIYSLSDFYFGARSSYQLATQRVAKMRQQAHWFYLQDDWKVNSKFTLNLGLRYELTTPIYDGEDKLSNFDPGTNKLITTKGGSYSERALRDMQFNNFAPRIGGAYQFTPKTVIRGGYGLGYNYWNRMASAELLGTNAPFVTRFSTPNSAANLGTLCTADNYLNCFRTREQGYPSVLPSNVILYIKKDLKWGYIQNWHLTVQRNLYKDGLIDIAYVGNKGSNLPLLGDFNQARPITTAEVAQGLTTLGTLLARRPYQGFNNITGVIDDGFSNYHSMQIKFEHRGRDFTFLNSFTFAKAIDNVGQVLENTNGGSPNPQDIRNPRNDKGASSFDQRFNNTASFVYSLPVGREKRFGKSMPTMLDLIIGGWQTSSIVSTTSGQPLNLRYPDTAGRLSDGQADFLGNVALRPNLIDPALGAKNPDGVRSYLNYFNRANLAIPDQTQPFGTLGRNVVYGFPLYQVDFTVSKQFPFKFREGANLMFRTEFFNVFNHTNFSAPTVDISNAAFGRSTSTFDPRVIQMALKLTF